MPHYRSFRKKKYYKTLKYSRKNSRKNKYRGGVGTPKIIGVTKHVPLPPPPPASAPINDKTTSMFVTRDMFNESADKVGLAPVLAEALWTALEEAHLAALTEEQARVKAEAERMGLGPAQVFPTPSAPYKLYDRGKPIYAAHRMDKRAWQYKDIPEYYTPEQRVALMTHLVTMLTTLSETIYSYIRILPTDSPNLSKLNMLVIIVETVNTTITRSSVWSNMLAEGTIVLEDLLNPIKQIMNNFIAHTKLFIPFQNQAKKIATYVIKWIDRAYGPDESNGDLSRDFVRDYTENGIWSMLGPEGKKILEDAEQEIKSNTV